MHHQARGQGMGGRGMGMNRMKQGNRGLGLQDRPAGTMRNEQLQLHDLDLELALLKRKRELIEQEQHLLIGEPNYSRVNEYAFNNREPARIHPFNAPEYAEPRSAPARNLGSYYGGGEMASTTRYDRPYGKRPPPASNWPTEPPTKRFNPGRGRRQRSGNTARPGPAPKPAHAPKPVPAPSKPVAKPANTNNAAPKARNFNPTKVTKPTQNSAPNKLNSYPVQERKNLVDQASHLTKDVDEFTLHESQPASRKLLARLESALGIYLKQMRLVHEEGPYAAALRSPFKLRLLKQSIRERIRAAMLGKHAGTGAEIMLCVRQVYPAETDEDILKQVSKTEPIGARLAIHPVESADPEIYMKQNFNLLLGRRLNEMFTKLQHLYSMDFVDNKTTQEIVDDLLVEMDKNPALKAAANGDAKETETPTAETVEEIQPIDNPLEHVKAEPSAETDTKEAEDSTPVAEGNAEQTASAPAPAQNAGDNLVYDSSSIVDRPASFYNKLVDTLIKRRLPQILPKYKDQLISILRADSGYTETKAYLLQQANKKAEAMYQSKHPQPENNSKDNNESQQTTAKGHRFYPYFVKVMGRPSLPKRKNMQVFLDQFNPACIKKHRGIHNLLFVALESEDDFQRLMASNKTVIGTSQLDIRVGGKGKDGQDLIQPVKPDYVTMLANEESKEQESNVNLDQSLEEQITDLLNSIGNDEAKVAGQGAKADAADADATVADAVPADTVQADDVQADDVQVSDDTETVSAEVVEAGNVDGEQEAEEPAQHCEVDQSEIVPEEEQQVNAANDDDVQILDNPNPGTEIIEIEDSQNDGAVDDTPATPARVTRQASKLGKN